MKSYDKVSYTQKDCMPAEVATAMLLRSKLTNRMRKVCMAAREKSVSSPSPILQPYDGLRVHGEPLTSYVTDPLQVARSMEDKADRRCEGLSLVRLLRLRAKTFRNRIKVQKPFQAAQADFQRMQAETDPAMVKANVVRYQTVRAILERLADEAERLDTIMEAIYVELAARGAENNLVAVSN